MRAVIFDWDLTLWDSWGIHLRLMENTAVDLGLAVPSPEAVAAEFHRPFRQHLLWFFGSKPDAEDEWDTILNSYLSRYESILSFRNYLFPGVASLLPALKRRGFQVGILSDKIPEFGHAELRRSGLVAFVDIANFKTDARPYKPSPDGLQTVLEGLAVDPQDAMYVGDGPQDIACARTVGAASAAALWSAIDRDATLEQGPTYRLHRPHQVMAVVADSVGSGTDPWVRHLPWPWRPDADNPHDDQDAAPESTGDTHVDPERPSWQSWPMANLWRGRTAELAQLPDDANPVAPISLRNPDFPGNSGRAG